MQVQVGPFSVSITRRPKQQPPQLNAVPDIASDLLDAAARLQPAAKRLLAMNLPQDSIACLQVVATPQLLLSCRADDALQALRHVAYLAVECNIATFK